MCAHTKECMFLCNCGQTHPCIVHFPVPTPTTLALRSPRTMRMLTILSGIECQSVLFHAPASYMNMKLGLCCGNYGPHFDVNTYRSWLRMVRIMTILRSQDFELRAPPSPCGDGINRINIPLLEAILFAYRKVSIGRVPNVFL